MRLLILLLLLGLSLEKPQAQVAWEDSIAYAYQLYENGQYHQAGSIAEKIAALSPGKARLTEQADAYSIMGLVAMANGDYRRAISLHKKALDTREKEFGKTSLRAAWSCQNLGICHSEIEEFDRALPYFHRALNAHLKDIKPDTLIFLKISIADCYRGDKAMALTHYNQVLAFAGNQQESKRFQAKVWTAMGRAYFDWGDFDVANSLFRKALAAAQSSCDLPTEGNALFNLGRTFFASGRTDEAIKYFRYAIQVLESSTSFNKSELAATRQSLAYVLLQAGDVATARYLLEGTQAFYVETPLSHNAVRNALVNASLLYYSGNLRAAEDSSLNILDMLNEIGNPPKLSSVVYNLLGDISMARKEPMEVEDAIFYYQYALRFAEQSKNDFAKAECLLRLANGDLEAGKINKSKTTLNDVVRLIDERLPKAKGLRALALLLSSRLAHHEKKFNSSIQKASEGLKQLGYPVTIQAEPFGVLSLLHQKAKVLKAQNPALAIQAYQDAESFLEKWFTTLKTNSRAELENMYYGIYEGLIDCLLKTGQIEEAFLFSDKSHAGALTVNLSTPPLNLTHLQKSLAPGTAMVEYFWGEEQVFAFLIKKEGITSFSIPISDSLYERTKRLYRNLSLRPKLRVTLEETVSDARFLFETILRPLYSSLPERCIIVPSGLLHLVPFEALLIADPVNYNEVKDFAFIVHEKILSYSPSASFWLAARQYQEVISTGKCYAFMPVFIDSTDPRPGITILPNSRDEISGISKVCRFEVFQEGGASKAKFLEVYTNARVLHLSTHAAADPSNRDNSNIVFYYHGAGRSEVTVADLLKLKSQAEMVVLSACETNLAQIYRAEGAWSLARAFLHGGSSSVITTLWKADDPSSAKLMTDFYNFLKAGKDKGEALTLAKRKYLLDTATGSFEGYPYYWSIFVVLGNEEPIELCDRMNTWLLAGWGLALAIVAGLLFIAKPRLRLPRWNVRKTAAR